VADLVRGVVRGSIIVGDAGARYETPLWAGDYTPVEGDPVMLLAQSGMAYVLGPASMAPRSDTGTIAGAPGLGRVPVTVGSVTYSARYIGTPGSIGDLVMLAWQGSVPWLVGTAGVDTSIVTPTPGDPTPPMATTSGTLHMPAAQSGSYRAADGWGRPGSRGSMSLNAVVQGTAPGSSYAYSGSWFYGSQANQLAGATLDAVRLRIGPRLEIGSYNAALAMHVYDGSRTIGPYDFTLAAHFGGGWIGTLPGGIYAAIAAGGGISITGSPYLGIAGLDVDPASGQLDVDWHR